MPPTQATAPDNGGGRVAHADQAGESDSTVPAGVKPDSKFDWLEQLLARTELSGSVKTVAARIAIKSVGTSKAMTFRVRQSTLATHCGMGERSVQRAFAELRDHGWIELVELRGARGLGHHQADQYRLALPSDLPANLAGSSDDIPANDDATYPPKMADLPAKTDTPTRQLGGTYPPKLVASETLSSEDDPLKGLKKVSSKGLRRGLDADCVDAVPANFVSDELPEKYCPAHMPLGTVDRCGPCGAADRIRKAAIADRTRDAQRVKTGLANALANCELCDEHGWRLGDDNAVDDRTIRCTHQKDGQEKSTP